MTLTARYPFSASHRLHSPLLSEQANDEVYGKCNNPHGHGHNYWLEVTVVGEADAETGLMVARQKLDQVVQQEILSLVSHRNLNEELKELKGLVPTTETLAIVLAGVLERSWPSHFPDASLRLGRLRIYETRNNRFEIEANEVNQ